MMGGRLTPLSPTLTSCRLSFAHDGSHAGRYRQVPHDRATCQRGTSFVVLTGKLFPSSITCLVCFSLFIYHRERPPSKKPSPTSTMVLSHTPTVPHRATLRIP
ncbi:hypothetical protein BO82DRAFT_181848 [Aspergillus uvarum CBS 121591]|uniref:Uncharacterized protein n=1 Tax=Aspergillus uvarum CBS 121591 TaxID=1448315 RepID=A0A319DB06_9EURO|nr:hypothetical protein BO82DRAFT_181848 [Aspergillus uvarum CBS 121591]PYH85228.1 hypothetical protein BO82DRAFT_181848 [Aspergillus uvarum CBS 121591]